MEQDLRSPHHYLDSIEEVKGKTFVDVGSAEGFTSLEVIEKASHIYLFEQDTLWIEALNATFEPWKDKVSIIPKYVSNNNSEQEITLDTFFKIKIRNSFLLKWILKELNGTPCKEARICSKIVIYSLPFALIMEMTTSLSPIF